MEACTSGPVPVSPRLSSLSRDSQHADRLRKYCVQHVPSVPGSAGCLRVIHRVLLWDFTARLPLWLLILRS